MLCIIAFVKFLIPLEIYNTKKKKKQRYSLVTEIQISVGTKTKRLLFFVLCPLSFTHKTVINEEKKKELNETLSTKVHINVSLNDRKLASSMT